MEWPLAKAAVYLAVLILLGSPATIHIANGFALLNSGDQCLEVSRKVRQLEKDFEQLRVSKGERFLTEAAREDVRHTIAALRSNVDGLPTVPRERMQGSTAELLGSLSLILTGSADLEGIKESKFDDLHRQALFLAAQQNVRGASALSLGIMAWALAFVLISLWAMSVHRRRISIQSLRVSAALEECSRMERAYQFMLVGAGTETSEGDLVSEALEAFVKGGAWESGHVWRPNSAGRWVSDGRFAGDSDLAPLLQMLTARSSVDSNLDVPGECSLRQAPLWIEDFLGMENSLRARTVGNSDIKSMLGIPIIADGVVIAVIELWSSIRRPVDDRLLNAAAHAAQQLGLKYALSERKRKILDQEQRLFLQQQELDIQHELMESQQTSLLDQRGALEEARSELERKEVALAESFEKMKAASEQAKNARDLHEVAARRWEELFNGIPVACFTCDSEGTTYEWNRAAETLWGIPVYEVLQCPFIDKIGTPETTPILKGALAKVFSNERVDQFELETSDANGSIRWVLVSVFPLCGPNGEVTGAVWAMTDNTGLKQQSIELATANAKLEALATSDGLTGLKNHRAFQEFFAVEFSGCKRYGTALSLILLDVDKFKQFNDTHGHPAGDTVLRNVALRLAEAARESDFVARYGGEEFVIVLPGTDAQGAFEAAERFRLAVEAAEWKLDPVTISLGVSTYRPEYEGADSMLANADQALYASKNQGRNRSTHADSLTKAA